MTPDRITRAVEKACTNRVFLYRKEIVTLLRREQAYQRAWVRRIVDKVKDGQVYGESYAVACSKIIAALRKGRP